MDTSGLLHMPAGTPQYGVSEDAYSQRVLAPLLALNARAGVFSLLFLKNYLGEEVQAIFVAVFEKLANLGEGKIHCFAVCP